MGTISKNFSYSEFERSETAEKKGIVNVIATARVRDSIQALVLNVLQPLRTALGVEMHINSGYRCPELNEAVGGVPTSQHMKGEAADIATPTPLRLARKRSCISATGWEGRRGGRYSTPRTTRARGCEEEQDSAQAQEARQGHTSQERMSGRWRQGIPLVSRREGCGPK